MCPTGKEPLSYWEKFLSLLMIKDYEWEHISEQHIVFEKSFR